MLPSSVGIEHIDDIFGKLTQVLEVSAKKQARSRLRTSSSGRLWGGLQCR